LKPRPGYIHAAHPLDICQIDHTPTDINFVEVVEGEGTFVGRAYAQPTSSCTVKAYTG
jgi:putative transposase